MKVKIIYHMMSWEIDYALFSFSQLKKSKYYLPDNIDITIDSVLNLSSYSISWKKSKLPKDYFIEKYNTYSLLLKDYSHNKKIYDGSELYGHLDNQRESVGNFDYYIAITPRFYFSETLLKDIVTAAQKISKKTFVITPQIHRLCDPSWNVCTDPKYFNIPFDDWEKTDTFDIRYNSKSTNWWEIQIQSVMVPKWAGWFDLYSKDFYEDKFPVPEDWKGYGQWDWWSMYITILTSKTDNNLGIYQYLLRNQTISFYDIGPLKETTGFSKHYKKFIHQKKKPDQRENFNKVMNKRITECLDRWKQKKLIPKDFDEKKSSIKVFTNNNQLLRGNEHPLTWPLKMQSSGDIQSEWKPLK